jgi:transketolase
MGDLVGNAVTGTLSLVPLKEFKRLFSLEIDKIEKAELFASFCRINTLYMIANAGSGHIGSSFSSMEIISWIHLNELRNQSGDEENSPRDVFFSSKGHDAPALYSNWIGLEKMEFDLIHKLRRLNGLPGHPDISTPNVVTNTGSLGMGLSKAKGMIFANRLKNRRGKIYVLTGDGELQEGQYWESLISAANDKLNELTVIIDHNKLQSDTFVDRVSDLGDLERKLNAFGWDVSRCDGNNVSEFSQTLSQTEKVVDKPKVIIADTIKGKGVSFMEHTSIDSDVELYKFHSGAPTEDAYQTALLELINNSNEMLSNLKLEPLELELVKVEKTNKPGQMGRLIDAYSQELLRQAESNQHIVALDADLILDTGLIPFKKQYPERFVECGIAEQDMVSQAGGMALNGLIPIVHSFACFLSARPNEQIYNNATEKSKIIYVGSLAGVVPAGPGHSHQAVRDITSLGAIPGLTIMEPCCEQEVNHLLNWAINKNNHSSYLRITSIPYKKNFDLPDDYKPEMGKGTILRKGKNITIIGYGPIMINKAIEAADALENNRNLTVKIISMPWLNYLNKDWLTENLNDTSLLITLDNQYTWGGLGHQIRSALFNSKLDGKLEILQLGINEIPVSGTNDEVLAHHNLDGDTIINAVISSKIAQ